MPAPIIVVPEGIWAVVVCTLAYLSWGVKKSKGEYGVFVLVNVLCYNYRLSHTSYGPLVPVAK